MDRLDSETPVQAICAPPCGSERQNRRGNKPDPNLVTRHSPVGDEESRTPMADGSKRYRLSILAFDEPVGLGLALNDLYDHGIATSQIGLIGLPETVDRLFEAVSPDERPVNSSPEIAALESSAKHVMRLDGDDRLAARYGTEIEVLLERPSRRISGFDWMQEGLAARLAEQAQRGAIVLLVSAKSADQHALSAKLLLRHGPHNLQTQEFWWPNSG